MCLEAAGDTTGQEFKLPQKQHLSVSMQNILYLHFSQEPPEIIPKSTQREIKPHLTTLREVQWYCTSVQEHMSANNFVCKQHLATFCIYLQTLHQGTNKTVVPFPTQIQTRSSFPQLYNKLSSQTEAPLYCQVTLKYTTECHTPPRRYYMDSLPSHSVPASVCSHCLGKLLWGQTYAVENTPWDQVKLKKKKSYSRCLQWIMEKIIF